MEIGSDSIELVSEIGEILMDGKCDNSMRPTGEEVFKFPDHYSEETLDLSFEEFSN